MNTLCLLMTSRTEDPNATFTDSDGCDNAKGDNSPKAMRGRRMVFAVSSAEDELSTGVPGTAVSTAQTLPEAAAAAAANAGSSGGSGGVAVAEEAGRRLVASGRAKRQRLVVGSDGSVVAQRGLPARLARQRTTTITTTTPSGSSSDGEAPPPPKKDGGAEK